MKGRWLIVLSGVCAAVLICIFARSIWRSRLPALLNFVRYETVKGGTVAVLRLQNPSSVDKQYVSVAPGRPKLNWTHSWTPAGKTWMPSRETSQAKAFEPILLPSGAQLEFTLAMNSATGPWKESPFKLSASIVEEVPWYSDLKSLLRSEPAFRTSEVTSADIARFVGGLISKVP